VLLLPAHDNNVWVLPTARSCVETVN